MNTTCPKCGLPKELCICESISKEQTKIKVTTKRGKYRKLMTIVTGINPKEVDTKKLLKYLKKELACGGAEDKQENTLMIQGNHVNRMKKLLIEYGFPGDSIEV
ncbi:MAG: stress response translation initiation inhibitor YciH [Nanoarchaeota archaeon]|nr:stress response translation initiation inhibitor YciH [Nanoarchaeota archaeon]